MYECKSWTIKKSEHQKTDAFELQCWRRLKSALDCKEIKLVNPKGNQPWIFFGRTDAEAVTPIVWPSDAKSQLTGKDPDAGKDWRQEEKEMTEDEMVGWHHWLNGHEFEQILGDSEAWCDAVHESQRVGHDLVTEPGWICTLHPSMLGVKKIFPWEMEAVGASSSEHLPSELQSLE